MRLAHIGGLPFEEGLLALAPAAGALAAVAAVEIRRLGGWLRQRRAREP